MGSIRPVLTDGYPIHQRSSRVRMNQAETATEEEPWVAVQTKPRYERISAQLLSEKGFLYFLPTYFERRRWSDRTKILEKPLFPGYIFCRTSLESVGSLLTTSGVLRVIGCSNRPEPIPDWEIEAIQRLVSSGVRVQRHEYLQVGTRVRLCSGPLAGTEGLLARKKDNCRLVVSVDLLRRSVSVEVDPDWVEKIPSLPGRNDRPQSQRREITAA